MARRGNPAGFFVAERRMAQSRIDILNLFVISVF
jgi:hypothetical protein